MLKLFWLIIWFIFFNNIQSLESLDVGFYHATCPSAEQVIRRVVETIAGRNNQTAAVLLRLHFHDCFVEGCDGSILLKGTDGDDESFAAGNAGVEGFEIIDQVKGEVERLCPNTVSCADIVALAATDSVSISGGPFYEVPTGRRDGRVSNMKNAANLPDPQEPVETLRKKFREKGLSDKDLVLLSAGDHTIGRTACFFVTPRINRRDPSIDDDFFKVLSSKCPPGGDVGVKIPLDWGGESWFDTHVFENIKSGRAVLASDSVLYRDDATKTIIDGYLGNSSAFAADFAGAMVKMGHLDVKQGDEGEIRVVCNVNNS